MKKQAANIYIGLVAALGLIVLVASSINVRTSAIDPIMFIFIMALVGIAQRNPVVLFRSSAISVAFAVKIAAYVLFGTPLALWATLVVVAVNAYTPKPKPARKVLFNFGQLMLATYLASRPRPQASSARRLRAAPFRRRCLRSRSRPPCTSS